MTIASLAMYPFLPLRAAQTRLWDGVRSRLSFAAPALDWEIDPTEASGRDDLLLGQTCGWPLVTRLDTKVHVVGTFDVDVDGAADGTYCSVLVTATGDSLIDVVHRPDLVVAANSSDSLSGWISMRSAAATHGVQLDAVTWTGTHALSVEMLRQGAAHLASIDAVSWEYLDHAGLSVIGRGPRVPCLPLITARSSGADLGELRRALAAVVHDPHVADACATLRIRGFLERDLADYGGILELAELG
ncbi:MAG: PhnD/SsuA/transferrin family substrate-binding protein [Ilumatobacteraceae bacterium]